MIYINPNTQVQEQKKRQQGGMSPMQGYRQYKNFSGKSATPTGGEDSMWQGAKDWVAKLFEGSGGEGGGGSGGESGLGTAGYVLAAIIAQNAATNSTGTVFEGQPTGNFFTGATDGGWSPSFATEPWLAWGHDQLGFDPTSGEKFDAALKNNDWDSVMKRFPAAADYWADPIRNWLGHDTWKNMVGDELAWLIDPIGGLFNSLEGIF